jgi:hypothetical protein
LPENSVIITVVVEIHSPDALIGGRRLLPPDMPAAN